MVQCMTVGDVLISGHPFYFFCYHVEVVADGLRDDFCVSLCLRDVGVSEHLADVFDFNPVAEHVGGECVTGEMAVHWGGYSCSHAECLEATVVVRVVELGDSPFVAFQDFDYWREELRDVWHAGLNALADVNPLVTFALVVIYIEALRVAVGQTCEHLEDKEVASECHLCVGCGTERHECRHFLFSEVFDGDFVTALEFAFEP